MNLFFLFKILYSLKSLNGAYKYFYQLNLQSIKMLLLAARSVTHLGAVVMETDYFSFTLLTKSVIGPLLYRQYFMLVL